MSLKILYWLKSLSLFAYILCLSNSLIAGSDYKIDEDSNPITDFRDYLQKYKVKTYLEFGPGVWTEYFLESCRKVISVEFVTPGYGPNVIKNYLGIYGSYSNWTPIIYFSAYQGDLEWAPYKYLGSEHVHKAASYQCSTHQNYALMDDFYLIELNAFIAGLVKYNKIEVAFVNSGLYIRGDLVQLMFGKIPIIFAKDSSSRAKGIENDVYGYSRIVTPEDYEEIYLQDEQGTTAWILKSEKYEELSLALKTISNFF